MQTVEHLFVLLLLKDMDAFSHIRHHILFVYKRKNYERHYRDEDDREVVANVVTSAALLVMECNDPDEH